MGGNGKGNGNGKPKLLPPHLVDVIDGVGDEDQRPGEPLQVVQKQPDVHVGIPGSAALIARVPRPKQALRFIKHQQRV
jgi:hypothetical protein